MIRTLANRFQPAHIRQDSPMAAHVWKLQRLNLFQGLKSEAMEQVLRIVTVEHIARLGHDTPPSRVPYHVPDLPLN